MTTTTNKKRPNGKSGWDKVKRDLTPTETQEQKMLFAWAKLNERKYPELALLFHIPNEGKRSKRVGHELVEMGMKKGVPDVCLPVPNAVYAALYIEMKRSNGGRASEDQKGWLAALNRVGNRAVVCYGFEDARKVILEYLRR